jgi:hypothetical protein
MGPAAAAAIYAAITAVMFRALLAGLPSRLYSYIGDPLLNATILAWNAAHVPLSEAWWNFPSFAPLTGVTAFTEHLLVAYPVASPVIWLTGNPVLAYNVLFLLAFPANGMAAYTLASDLTGSRAGAFVAGLAFAFAPYQAVHLSHLQMMLAFGMPLTLLGLHRWMERATPRALLLCGAGWLMTSLSNGYMLAFFPVVIALWCAWFLRGLTWRRVAAPIAVLALATLPVLPLLWGYHVRQAEHGLVRGDAEIQSFSADLTGLAQVSYRAAAWRQLLPNGYQEGALFPGVTIAVLALIGLAAGTRRYVFFYGLAAAALWLMTLGPGIRWHTAEIGPGPYRLLMEIPGLHSLRVPARAWMPAILCLAVLAAYGTVALGRRYPRRQALVLTALATLVVAEGWASDAVVAVPDRMRSGVIPNGAVVLDLPVEEAFWNAIPQYRGVMGGYRTVNGYSGYEPPAFQPLRHAIAERRQEALDAYRARADLWVVVRPEESMRVKEWIPRQPRAVHVFDADGARIYRLPRLVAAD